MFCARCGSETTDGARYCSGCGLELDGPTGQDLDASDPPFAPEPSAGSRGITRQVVAASALVAIVALLTVVVATIAGVLPRVLEFSIRKPGTRNQGRQKDN
jgi:uncharacterized membrane protein YvbJ